MLGYHQLNHSSNVCNFCKRNKEPEAVYRNHQLKDREGRVVCPQLSKYICELCGSTGPEAHTRSYCPLVKSMRRQPTQTDNNRYNSTISINSNSYEDSTSSSCTISIARRGMFRNMGRVTNSRYNSAGKIRNLSAAAAAGGQSNNHYYKQSTLNHNFNDNTNPNNSNCLIDFRDTKFEYSWSSNCIDNRSSGSLFKPSIL